MEEKILYGLLTVYRERGYYLRRLEQFEKAKLSYDEALKHFPEDVRLLIGRSQTCKDAVKSQEAFENAEAALKVQNNNMQARNVQACALYTLSEFEHSLVINWRGARKRHQPPYFREGISQGQETLQNCVGVNAGPVMLDFLPIIEQNIAAIGDENEPIAVKHVSRIPQKEIKKNLTQIEIKRHRLLSRVLAMKYLGPMASDKFFLQNLSEDRRLQGANQTGSQKLKDLVDESLSSLSERQEILRTQCPYYAIKFAEKLAKSTRLALQKKKLLLREREVNTRNADKMIKAVEKARQENNMKYMMLLAERFQSFLDSKTPRNLNDKDGYIDRLYRCVGRGYFDMHRLSYRLSEQANRQRIAFLMHLPLERLRSYDSVRATYPYKFQNIKDAIESAYLRLESCENGLMKCWLYYELACLLNRNKEYALSKFYAKRCQREAQEQNSTFWWLNACFTLIGGDMEQGNVNDVRTAVEQAYNYSKNLLDPEMVQAFLTKCLDMMNEPVQVDDDKIVRQREKNILKVMEDPTRVNTQVLFKNIMTVPPGRRFKVLPTPTAMEGQLVSERTRYRQYGLTVIPGKEKGLAKMQRSKIRGYQIFDVQNQSRK